MAFFKNGWWIAVLYIGIISWFFRVPDRIRNQLDYPVGTKLRALPVHRYNVPQADTIEVTGYSGDYIHYRITNRYFWPIVPTGSDRREDFQYQFKKMSPYN